MRADRIRVLILLSLFSLLALSLLQIQVPQVKAEENTPSTIGTYTTNWSGFWQTFNSYSQWSLEWFDGAEWQNRKSCLQVIRDYPNASWCKITLNFTSQEAGDYRLSFAIDKRVRNYVEKASNWRYTLTYEDYTVVFDWSDIKDISGLIVTHGVQDGYFWFRIRRNNIPADYNVEIDPSIIGSAPSLWATGETFSRKSFYANGRYWAFYSDGTSMKYSSSVDGDSWASAITVRSCWEGYLFAVTFDGTYVHYAYSTGGDGGGLLYRMGSPLSNGTVSWVDSEQTVEQSGTKSFYGISICADSSGYPFIGYWGLNSGSNDHPNVTKSSTKNGTWTTDSGFPYQLHSGGSDVYYVGVVPLDDDKVYAGYVHGVAPPLYGRLYNGSDWESEEQIASGKLANERAFCLGSIGDVVHATYQRSGGSIRYRQRQSDGTWDAEQTIDGGATYSFPVITENIVNSTVFVLWSESDTVYYRNGLNDTWGTTQEWFTDAGISDRVLQTPVQTYQYNLMLLYTDATEDNVKWNYQNIAPYTFTFHGVYDEDTGLWNPEGCNVTAYYSDGNTTETFEVNGSHIYNSISTPLYFHFSFQESADIISQYASNLLVYNQSNYYDIIFIAYEDDTDYEVSVTLTWNSTYTITDKTTTGCRVNFGTPPSGSQYLSYHVYRTMSSGKNPREYWLSDEEYSGTIYIFDVFDGSTTAYTVQFIDLTGVLDDYPYILAQRYINGSLMIVEKRKTDASDKIVMALKSGEKYTIIIRNGITYTYGDIAFTSTPTTVTLYLNPVNFPSNLEMSFKYVRMYAYRHNNFSSITMLYQDNKDNTEEVELNIELANGTSVYSSTQYASSFIVTWASAVHNTTYYVSMTTTHGDYGTLEYRATLYRGGFGQSPWGMDWLGSFAGGMSTASLLPIFLILCCAGIFSKVNAYVGAFLCTILTALFTLWGWISVAPSLLILAFTLSLLMAIGYKKKEVKYS